MRVQAYFRLVGHEVPIQSIKKEIDLLNAFQSQLEPPRSVLDLGIWWGWKTPRVTIDANNPDQGLLALLNAHKPIFPIIKKHKTPDVDFYLEVVMGYEKDEPPTGFYLSADAVRLLGEAGGALDIDAVSLLPNSSAKPIPTNIRIF